MQWHTSGFWGETCPEAIWETLKREWFPTPEDLDKRDREHAARCAARGIEPGIIHHPEVFHKPTPEEQEDKLREMVMRMVS